MNNAQVINSHSSPGGVQDTLLNESLYVVFAIGFWVLAFCFGVAQILVEMGDTIPQLSIPPIQILPHDTWLLATLI